MMQTTSNRWDNTTYDVVETLSDRYYFAGSAWNTQIAKRFVLKTKRFGKIIESSYYLHLKADGTPFNIAFEPSTSFGCSVGCLFCASGTLFPIKSLNADEIAEQVLALIDIYEHDLPEFSDVREDVFYSGIGEPTLMMNTLIESSHKILAQRPNIQFKISTMGAMPSALLRWADSGLPLRSIQLGIPHWDEDKIKHLYSKCDKYNLQNVLHHIKQFMERRPETCIKINYIGIKGYNDATDDLVKTAELVTHVLGNQIEFKLSCLNPTEFAANNMLHAIPQEQLETMASVLQPFGLKHVYTFGPMSNEKLGCGQLAGNYS